MKRTAENIVIGISKLDSIYGYSAKLLLEQNGNFEALILEVYNEIKENKSIVENHFGESLVKEIYDYIKRKNELLSC
jgi:hypothetical protein